MSSKTPLTLLLAISLAVNAWFLTRSDKQATPSSAEAAPPAAPVQAAVEKQSPTSTSEVEQAPFNQPALFKRDKAGKLIVRFREEGATRIRVDIPLLRQLDSSEVQQRLKLETLEGTALTLAPLSQSRKSGYLGQAEHAAGIEGVRLTVTREDGSLARFEYKLSGSLLIGRATASQKRGRFELICEANRPVKLSALKDFLKIEPAVETRARRDYRGRLILAGNFEPKTAYTLHFAKGLPSQDGYALEQEHVVSVRTSPIGKHLDFAAQGPYYPRHREGRLPVWVSGLKQAKIEAYRIYPNNLLEFIRDGDDYTYRTAKKLADYTYKPAVGQERRELDYLDLGKILGDAPTGFYVLKSSFEGDTSWRKPKRTLVITDLAVQASLTGRKLETWVSSLKDGLPVAGCEVEIRSEQDQRVAMGITDEQGLLRLELPASAKHKQTPYYLLARKGEDTSYLRLLPVQAENLSALKLPSHRLSSQPYQAEIFSERGVYRPGETVYLSAIVRTDTLAACAEVPATMTIRDPANRVVRTVHANLNEHGFFETQVELPASARLGHYRVNLHQPGAPGKSWGKHGIRVTHYTPNRIELSLKSDRESVRAGEQATFEGLAHYYFGSPASRMSAHYRSDFQSVPFQPKGYEDYVFGLDEGLINTIPKHRAQLQTDADGKTHWSLTIPKDRKETRPIRAQVSLSISDLSGGSVSETTSITIHPRASYLGLRKAPTGDAKESDFSIQWVCLDPQGESTAMPEGLRFELESSSWDYVLGENTQGNRVWKWKQSYTLERQLEGEAGQAGAFRSNDLPPGHYRVSLRDAQGLLLARESYYHSWGGSSPPLGQITHLRLNADRETYLPGKPAKVSFEAPAAGQALLTIHHGSEQHSSLHSVEAGENSLSFQIPRTPFGSAYCAVTLVKTDFRQAAVPRRLFGMLHLPIDQERERLQVAIEAPELARPGQPCTLKLSLSKDGAPAAGTLKLMLVDEGLLALTSHKTPDPFTTFFKARAPSLQFYHMFGGLFPELDAEAGKASAIGGGGGGSLRPFTAGRELERRAPAVLVPEAIRIDEDGQAELTLTLPDHSGQLRIMAVALDAIGAGSAERAMKLRHPFGIEVDLPKAVAPGDRFAVTLTAHNHSAEASKARVTLKSEGSLALNGSHELQFELAAGERWERQLEARALKEAVGAGTVRAELSLGGESRQASRQLLSRPAWPRRQESHWLRVEAGQSRELPAAGEWLEGTLRRQISVSATPLVELAPVVAWLQRYPYGCLEQTVSAAFPSLLLADLLPSASGGPTADQAKLALAVDRLLQLERYDGGFAMWPGRRETWQEGSLHACLFLAEAKASGLTLPDGLLARSTAYLRRVAHHSDNGKCSYEERAYALWVLARLGQGEAELALALSRDSQSTDFGKILLAGSLTHSGRNRDARELLEPLLAKGDLWSKAEQSSDLLGRRHSRLALALAILAELTPDSPHAHELASWLRSGRLPQGHWGNTIENALVTYAFGKLARYGGFDADSKGTLRFAEGSVQTVDFEQPYTHDSEEEQPLPLAVQAEGPGPLYLADVQTGFPLKPPTERQASHGITVTRELLDEDGKPLTKPKQGQLVRVRIQCKAAVDIENVVVLDLLPGFLEIEDGSLATRVNRPDKKRGFKLHFCEKREDRLLLFGDFWKDRLATFEYTTRVVSPGQWQLGGVSAEGMYRPELSAYQLLEGWMEVSP